MTIDRAKTANLNDQPPQGHVAGPFHVELAFHTGRKRRAVGAEHLSMDRLGRNHNAIDIGIFQE